MMKSPTSLIRIRYAVGVMLALSAVFAVVVSTVTLNQDRAVAQDPPVTVNLPAEAITVSENDGTATVTLTLGEAVAAGEDDVVIPVTVEDGTALASTSDPANNDYVTPATLSVTFTGGGAATGDLPITIVNPTTADDEPQESFTVRLGTSLPEGYTAGDNTSVTVIINDDDNENPSPTTITIDVNDAQGNAVDEDDQDPPQKITNFIPKVGHVLTANTSAVVDGDQPLTADPDDDAAARDAPSFVYQWIRLNDGSTAADDDDAVIEGATSSTYTLTDEDVGDTFTVQVWSSDNFDNGNGNANTDDATTVQGENSNGFTLGRPAAGDHGTGTVAYNQAKPFIIIGALQPEGDETRLEPGVVLTRDSSGLSSTMVNGAGNLISGFDEMGAAVEVMVDLDNDDPDNDGFLEDGTTAATARTPVLLTAVTFTWYRGNEPIAECIPASDTAGGTEGDQRRATLGDLATALARDAAVDTSPCTGSTYELVNADVADDITVKATYITRNAADPDGTPGNEDDVAELTADPISSEDIGRVYSPNLSTGRPQITGTAQVGSSLMADAGNMADVDADSEGSTALQGVTYEWFFGDDDDYSDSLGTGPTLQVKPEHNDNAIKVVASFTDALDDPGMLSSLPTTKIVGSPGEISRIEPTIRGVTVSAGDKVILSVIVFGLQNLESDKLGGDFEWSVDGTVDADLGSGREINYTAPSQPGTFTVTASLGGGDCQPELKGRTDAEARAEDCNAEFEVKVRRPSAAPPEAEAPVNPPGPIPTILTDSDGNQYEVFTPVDGGIFTGENYTISGGAGVIPNGEVIGIRMSDEGAASNLGMTHQRYTIGGSMYAISAVDSSEAPISSYVLNDAATVCVPLPAELRTNISDVALVVINSDDSLTILAGTVNVSPPATVCGSLSSLPAKVAVGAAGAPAPIPTPVPEPTPEPPATGGAAPASGGVLWALVLGLAVATLGGILVMARRRESVSREK